MSNNPSSRGGAAELESDNEDEMPDYRVLSAMTKRHVAGSDTVQSIPKRGEKDFEPTGFGGQSKMLEQSRAALFGAISLERAHSSRSLCTATWDPIFKRAFLHVQRGQACAQMGISERRIVNGEKMPATLELLPEETVYLIERGALDCRWTRTPGQVPSTEDHANCIPLSVAQAYAMVLGQDRITPERYQIYAYLKRLGYIVQRASVIDTVRTAAPANKPYMRDRIFQLLGSLLRYLARPLAWLVKMVMSYWRRYFMAPRGLLGISPYDTYDNIFNSLRIVHSTHQSEVKARPNPELEPFFYAWRPATHFRRTAPPPPEFCICIIDTATQPLFNLHDFGALFAKIPFDEQYGEELTEVRERNRLAYGKQKQRPSHEKQSLSLPNTRITLLRQLVSRVIALFARLITLLLNTCSKPRRSLGNIYPPLKAGRRNVVVAVIEQGTATLLRFGESEFERLRLAG